MRLFLTILVCLALSCAAYAQCSTGQCNTCPGGTCGVGVYQEPSNWQPVVKARQDFQPYVIAQTGPYKAAVRVSTIDADGGQSKGSGCAVMYGSRCVVLTANHVIKDAQQVNIRGNTRWHRCQVLGVDRTWDVAILSVNEKSDFTPATLADGRDGPVKVGDSVQTMGFGSNDLFAVNNSKLVGFGGPVNTTKTDWMTVQGAARSGDSGGPIFRRGKVVGVLWGSDGRGVVGTQIGRLHLILGKVLGRPTQDQYASVPERQLCSGGLLPKLLPQRQPQQPQVQQPQNVVVQADPRVGTALQGIDHKLDQVVYNTTPKQEAPPKDTDKGDTNGGLLLLCIIGGTVLAAVLYYVVGKN